MKNTSKPIFANIRNHHTVYPKVERRIDCPNKTEICFESTTIEVAMINLFLSFRKSVRAYYLKGGNTFEVEYKLSDDSPDHDSQTCTYKKMDNTSIVDGEIIFVSRDTAVDKKSFNGVLLCFEFFDDSRLSISSPDCLVPQGYIDLLLERIQSGTNMLSNCKLSKLSVYNDIYSKSDGQISSLSKGGVRKSLIDLFGQIVTSYPDSNALIYNNEKTTYGELDIVTTNVAFELMERYKLKSGDIVACFFDKSDKTTILFLSLQKIGATFLPISTRSPMLRVQELLSKSSSSLLILDSDTDFFTDLDVQVAKLSDFDFKKTTEIYSHVPSTSITKKKYPYLIYTSGTTGTPKGVKISEEGIINTALDHIDRFKVSQSDNYLQFMSESFDGSLLDTLTTILSGATLVIPCKEDVQDPEKLESLIQKRDVTITTITPSYLESINISKLHSLRIIVSAGEVLNRKLANRISDHCDLYNGYGPTEAAVNTTIYKYERIKSEENDSVPIGKPSKGKTVLLVNKDGEICDKFILGEIAISGPGVIDSYFVSGRSRANKITRKITGAKGDFYFTGDYGFWDKEGDLHFIGREDEQIKRNGFRIDLSEINQTILNHNVVRSSYTIFYNNSISSFFCKQDTIPAFVPSLGEYGVYDKFIYDSMATDPVRVNGYLNALREKVTGKIVLDPGTGSEMILTDYCIKAGADKVIAVEIDRDAYLKAKKIHKDRGYGERVSLLYGDIRDVDLPDSIEVVVSALAGNIASTDGCIEVMNYVKDAMNKSKIEAIEFVPDQYKTLIAGIDMNILNPIFGLSEVSKHYVEEVFGKYRKKFDLRLCIQNFDVSSIVTSSGICEDIRYSEIVPSDEITSMELDILENGCISGFVLWLNAFSSGEIVIDSIKKTHHLPVYIPLEVDVSVNKSDKISLTFTRKLSADNLHPDYFIEGVVSGGGNRIKISGSSRFIASGYRVNKFYDSIFRKTGQEMYTSSVLEFLNDSLPSYMIPNNLEVIESIPLTKNGKVDRDKLLSISKSRLGTEIVDEIPLKPDSKVSLFETRLCNIWKDIFGGNFNGIKDNFYSLGGDSITVIQMVKEAEKYGLQIKISDVISNPTIEGLSLIYSKKDSSSILPSSKTKYPETLNEQTSYSYSLLDIQKLMLREYDWKNKCSVYHCSVFWELDKEYPEISMIKGALQRLYKNHSCLGTIFHTDKNGIYTQLRTNDDIEIETLNIDSDRSKDEVYEEIIDQDLENRFKIGAPMVRFKIVAFFDGRCSVFLSFHHAIIDGWSGSILRKEFANSLYSEQLADSNCKSREDRSHIQAVKLQRTYKSDDSRILFWSSYLNRAKIMKVVETTNASQDYINKIFKVDGRKLETIQRTSETLGVSIRSLFILLFSESFKMYSDTVGELMAIVSNGRRSHFDAPLKSTGMFWDYAVYRHSNRNEPAFDISKELDRIENSDRMSLIDIEKKVLKSKLVSPCINFVNFSLNDSETTDIGLSEGRFIDVFHFPINITISLITKNEYIIRLQSIESFSILSTEIVKNLLKGLENIKKGEIYEI